MWNCYSTNQESNKRDNKIGIISEYNEKDNVDIEFNKFDNKADYIYIQEGDWTNTRKKYK